MRGTLRPVLTLAGLAPALWPATAGACATCLSSPWGDRTFNWAFLGLLLMPFAVAAVIGGLLTYRYTGLGPLRRALGGRAAGRTPTPESPTEERT